jgi:asparagine synthase (glutamine-hydrolysing)
MTGLCLAIGVDDASAAVKRMLSRLATAEQITAAVAPKPDLALGHAWRARAPHLRAPVRFDDGLICAVSGDIFDDHGVYADPEHLVADLYRSDHLHRIAWLNGSFSVAILDPSKNRAALITDRLGSKPLFIWHSGNKLMASSRLRALIAEEAVPKRMSMQGVTELLAYQRTIASHTQYADVMAMTASQIWVWQNGKLTKRTARKLSWTKPEFSKSEAAEGLAAALTRATARRLSDPVRHGLLMSGGLDSRIVLAAAHRSGKPISCTTVGAWDNTEVSIARQSSALVNAPFKLYRCDSESLAKVIAPATAASDGLFSAPINLYASLHEIARDHDVMLSGHGLDYTLRGYYLPCQTLRVAGSVTRLPRLRKIANGTAETISNSLRVGISPETAKKILTPAFAAEFDERRVNAMEAALTDVEIEDAYNGWDAFILHALGRHYAYSDFVAIEEIIDHRAIAFDPVVFDLYLSMPPSWRAEGRVAHAAMMRLSPELMRLPDANSGFSARFDFSKQIMLVLMRAILRRFGVFRQPSPPDPSFTHGSWLDTATLFRRDTTWRGLAVALPTDPVLNASGLFRQDGLEAVIAEHMEGKANHMKLIMQLLSIASWVASHPFDEVAA